MAPCKHALTFYHICGHVTGCPKHNDACPLSPYRYVGNANPQLIFNCPEPMNRRYTYDEGKCPDCAQGHILEPPQSPDQLTRDRLDHRAIVYMQNALDRIRTRLVYRENEAAEEEHYELLRVRKFWLIDHDRRRRAAEAAGTSIMSQSLIFRPDTASSMLLWHVSARGEDCSICSKNMKLGDDVRQLPCGHRLHTNCIFAWLQKGNMTCPSCRQIYKIIYPPTFFSVSMLRGLDPPAPSGRGIVG
ncbi:hypothetical protein DL95DRAFT_454309 [Leptodontidium sp. 2 PMI_412]|nr:hypothetical protein DL95DRAFT_454309 [Leptodontidium sp. 2 PMI_412]